jgi:hypothetical protein
VSTVPFTCESCRKQFVYPTYLVIPDEGEPILCADCETGVGLSGDPFAERGN